MSKPLAKCAGAPCKSCPYRRDVPSGVWAADEYAKLPAYDGDIGEQLAKGATGLFMCHQQDGCLCAGWVGAHGANNLLALRLHGHKVDPSAADFVSPVPLFSSGAQAATHGRRAIDRPGSRAQRTIKRLVAKRASKADGAPANPKHGQAHIDITRYQEE